MRILLGYNQAASTEAHNIVLTTDLHVYYTQRERVAVQFGNCSAMSAASFYFHCKSVIITIIITIIIIIIINN